MIAQQDPGRRRPTINSAAIVDSPSVHQTLVTAGQRSIGMFE
jgi:hypothetical protein